MRNLILVPLAAALMAGCPSPAAPSASSASSSTRAAPRIEGSEAQKLVAGGALLVDVRSPEEYADGHLDGARNIPLDVLQGALGGLPRDKPIIVYCAVGSRAGVAATHLAEAGYDVRNLGAMANWSR